MLCRDVMKTEVFYCHETDSAMQCAQIMKDRNIGFLPVLDAERRVVGIVTDRDLALRIVACALPAGTRVGLVMTRDICVCRPEDDLQSAERKMATARKSRLVVTDQDGRCAGVISLSDIARAVSSGHAGNILYAITRREAAGAGRTERS
jgi:CBS domain-containing protein